MHRRSVLRGLGRYARSQVRRPPGRTPRAPAAGGPHETVGETGYVDGIAGNGACEYAVIAVGADGVRSDPSRETPEFGPLPALGATALRGDCSGSGAIGTDRNGSPGEPISASPPNYRTWT